MSPADRLGGPVLVDGADEGLVGFGDDPVVADLGDGAAGGERDEPGAPATPDLAVDARRGAPRRPAAPPGHDAVADQVEDLVEVVPVEVAVGVGPAHQRRRGRRRCHSSAAGLGDDLLGEDVERRRRRVERIETPAAHRGQQGACTRRARRGSAGTAGPSACRGGCGWSARPAAGRWRSTGASRSGRPARPGRRRCRARATRWPPGPELAGAQAALDPVAAVLAERLPWWAATTSSPRRSPSWWARRSARRRVLTNTSVVRCWPTSSAMRSSTLVHLVVRRRPPRARRRGARWPDRGRADGPRRRSRRRSGRSPAGASAPGADQQPGHGLDRALGGRQPDPGRAARRQTWSRRSRVRARCAPRLSRAMAWISSTMTVSTRAQDLAALGRGDHQVQRLGGGDEEACGRLRTMACALGRRWCRRCGPRR